MPWPMVKNLNQQVQTPRMALEMTSSCRIITGWDIYTITGTGNVNLLVVGQARIAGHTANTHPGSTLNVAVSLGLCGSPHCATMTA